MRPTAGPIALMLACVLLACCGGRPDGTSAAATLVAAPTSALPPGGATAPVNYPGLQRVVAYAEGLCSGAVPEGETGFATLAALGIRTVISVDGAKPDVELARRHGLRYVHLPIGYDGMDERRTLEIARAVRDLPGPVYLHCHHGMHRAAAAAAATAVTLGLLTPEQATARMQVSGTAPAYQGLFRCVAAAHPAGRSLDGASTAFPETWPTSGLVEGMVAVDEAFDLLKASEQAGWRAPADHPGLVPAAEAGRLADLLRILADDAVVRAKPAEFAAWIAAAGRRASALEEGLVQDREAVESSRRFKAVAGSCSDCHVKYRN